MVKVARCQGRGSVGIAQDRFESRHRPGANAARQASSTRIARSERLHWAFETRTYRDESVGRPELALVRPASLCRVVLAGKSVCEPARSRTRSAESASSSLFLENRPRRTARLASPSATVSRALQQYPARRSGAVTRPDLAVPCGERRQRTAPQHSTTRKRLALLLLALARCSPAHSPPCDALRAAMGARERAITTPRQTSRANRLRAICDNDNSRVEGCPRSAWQRSSRGRQRVRAFSERAGDLLLSVYCAQHIGETGFQTGGKTQALPMRSPVRLTLFLTNGLPC